MSWTLMGVAFCAGWLGLLFYALASGLPILIQGFLGPVVQRRKPNLLSFTDFVAQVQCAACTPAISCPKLEHLLLVMSRHLVTGYGPNNCN